MESGTELLIGKAEPPIGWMIFNQPERRNAVSVEMWEAIPRVLGAFDANPAIRVIVVAGAGDKAFASGGDISQFEKQRSTQEHLAVYERLLVQAGDSLRHVSKPTIAMIRGYCMGGGLIVALLCDLRITADDGRFGIPAAKLGIGYGMEPAQRLVEIVGPAYAKEILFTGRQFGADEALAMRLVNKVVPVADLERTVQDYGSMIAGNAPLSLKCAKLSVNAVAIDLSARGERPAAAVKACMDSNDYREGRRAFMEKRKPKFTGT